MKEIRVKSLLPVRLDKYLMELYPALGQGRLNKALRENKIKLNGKKQPLSTRVQNGDVIRLFLREEQLEERPIPPAVFVYEDEDIIVAHPYREDAQSIIKNAAEFDSLIDRSSLEEKD